MNNLAGCAFKRLCTTAAHLASRSLARLDESLNRAAPFIEECVDFFNCTCRLFWHVSDVMLCVVAMLRWQSNPLAASEPRLIPPTRPLSKGLREDAQRATGLSSTHFACNELDRGAPRQVVTVRFRCHEGLRDSGRVQRSSKKISLGKLATERFQQGHLFTGLHPFRYDLHAQVSSKAQNGLYDLLAFAVV